MSSTSARSFGRELGAARWVLAIALAAIGIGAWVVFAGRGEDARALAAMDDSESTRDADPEVELARAASTLDSEIRSGLAPVQARQIIAAVPTSVGAVDTLRIDITTAKGLGTFSEPAPNIALAAGIGAPFDPALPARVTATSDAAGRASIELDWNAIEAARINTEVRLWLRVTSPGHAEHTQHMPLPETRDTLKVQLRVQAGMTVHGRVLTANGAPVVALVRALSPLTEATWFANDRRTAPSDGWFAIDLTAEGTYHIVADADLQGTAARLDHVVESSAQEPVILRIDGPGCVRGRVRDSSYRAVAGLELSISVAELDDPLGTSVGPEVRARKLELDGRGRSQVTLRTDADGHFEAQGLRSDRYVVRARRDDEQGYSLVLTPAPVSSNGADLDLVFDRPHLVVTLRNEDGSAYEGMLDLQPDHFDEASAEWPGLPKLIVSAMSGEAVLDGERRRRVRMASTGFEFNQAFLYEVSDDRNYLVGLLGGAMAWSPVVVHVPRGAGRVEARVVAARAAPPGSLIVEAVRADGSETDDGLRVRVEDVTSGRSLLERSGRRSSSIARPFQLPAGEYRVIVEGDAVIGAVGHILEPRACGRFETTVRIESQRESRVRATLGAGARIRLTLHGEVVESDREAIRRRSRGESFGSFIDLVAGNATITLESPGRWPIPVYFADDCSRSTTTEGSRIDPVLSIEDECLSELVPAGPYRLVARMPGGRVASAQVVLVDGETLAVSLVPE